VSDKKLNGIDKHWEEAEIISKLFIFDEIKICGTLTIFKELLFYHFKKQLTFKKYNK
jgi:hypothetical protein